MHNLNLSNYNKAKKSCRVCDIFFKLYRHSIYELLYRMPGEIYIRVMRKMTSLTLALNRVARCENF